MRKVGICLTSLDTGEAMWFGSLFDATDWLGRSSGYINYCIKHDAVATNFNTGERFKCSRDTPIEHKVKLMPIIHHDISGFNLMLMLQKSICNNCARSVGFCSWSSKLKPVEGWEAVQSFDVDGNPYSYCVRKCPLYMADGETARERKKQRKQLLKEMEECNSLHTLASSQE